MAKESAAENNPEKKHANEAELIQRILAGERELYYDLVAPYSRPVYVSAFSILRNAADAEDCAQEAILKALRHLGDFRGQSKFGSWLVQIAINEARMRIRKLRTRQYESLDEVSTSDEGEYVPDTLSDWRAIPSEALELQEVKNVLVDAVQRLPEIYRDVFVLRDVENQDTSSTAQILGITEAAVKTRLLRARLQMRDMVSPVIKNSTVFSRRAFKKGKNPWG